MVRWAVRVLASGLMAAGLLALLLRLDGGAEAGNLPPSDSGSRLALLASR